LGAGAGRHQEAADALDVGELDMRLFPGLAAHDVGGGLAGIYDAGHDLDEPGIAAGRVGAGPELLDQHEAVEHRIVGQHRGGLAALEHFADEGLAPIAVVALVADAVAIDLEPALVDGGLLDDLDVVARELRRKLHEPRAPVMNNLARPSTKAEISSG